MKVLDLAQAVAAEERDAETTAQDESVKFAASVDPLIFSESAYTRVKTPAQAMNEPADGLVIEIVGSCESETFFPERTSSEYSPCESLTAQVCTARSLQVFDPLQSPSTENTATEPDTESAEVPDAELTVKHPLGENSLDESMFESVDDKALSYVRAIPVFETNAAETKCGYVMASAVIAAPDEDAAVDSKPLDLRTTT